VSERLAGGELGFCPEFWLGGKADDAQPRAAGCCSAQQPRGLFEALLRSGNGGEDIEALWDVDGKALRHQAAKRLVDVALGVSALVSGKRETTKQALGASRVFIFDHVQRRRVDGVDRRQAGMPRQPATRVHVDHTARSGPQRVRDLLGEDAEELLRGRVQVVNLWRPTLPEPLRDSPLAVCDARSVDFADLVPSDLVYRDRVGETYSVRYNPAHQWYYVPEMRRDEALLLKCCDTKTDRARFMPHTGFTDPTTPPDAAPRESIELRSLVFHPA